MSPVWNTLNKNSFRKTEPASGRGCYTASALCVRKKILDLGDTDTPMKFRNLNTKKFEYFCSRAAAGIGILILGFLSLYSLFYTEKFTANHSEELEVSRDPVILSVLAAALVIVLLFYAAKVILKNEQHKKRNIRILLIFTCAYVAVFGFAWAFLCNYHAMWDAQMISWFANLFANGEGEISAHDIDYIASYPHQLGLIAVEQVLYTIFGWENYRAFQALNALGAAGIVFTGYRLVKEISRREEPGVYFLLLMLGCWPLIIYVPFMYGEILSILFSMLSIYLLILYLRKQRRRDAVYMALAITAACLIRSNCYIVLAAMGCVLAVKVLSEKKAVHILAFALCCVVFFLSHAVLVKSYEQKLGVKLDEAMPSVLWVAMSTQEGEAGKEAGWYNGLAWDLFVDEAGRDQEKAKELAYEVIEESATNFKENPSYMLDFYKRKIVSQWSEPTYGSQVETNHRKEARAPIMDSLYKGELWQPFVRVMDVYQSLIYFGVLLFLVLLIRKQIPVEHLGLLIVIIGGFIFYIFWEAKSRYVFPYFIMMIPMAAMGWELFLQRISALRQKYREKFLASGREPRRFPVEKLEPLASKLILIGTGVPAAFLFLYSLIFTTVYESNDFEIPVQTVDPVPLILAFTAAGVIILAFAGRLLLKNEIHRKRNLNLLLSAVLLHCVVFCIAWNLLAQSALRADPLYIHVIAGGFATGSVSESGMDYLYTYPHQAGQALLLELVYRIFGYENLLAFRMLNTLGVLVFVYSGYRVTGLLYEKDTVKVNFLLLAAGCVPLLIYTNVVYGEVLAVTAVAFALWMLLLWMKQEKLWQFLLIILSMVFAVYMKNNSLIAAVAMGGVMLCKAVSEHRKKLALSVIPLAAVLLLAQPLMTEFYEQRSGWPLDRGMPKNLWVAMGLQGEGMTSGWWNEFPDKIYKEQAGYDPQLAEELGDAAISLSLEGFRENPKAAAVFFARKFVSQWNDASYGCQVTAGSQDTPVLELWMNGFQSLVMLGAAAFALLRLKRQKKVEECLPHLILLGGYLFHMVWEVKGRYGLFYFVLLLPAAADGLNEVWDCLRILGERKKKKKEMTDAKV